jgi:Fe-S-cluster containining protein
VPAVRQLLRDPGRGRARECQGSRAIAALLGIDAAAFRSRYVHPDGERLKDGLGNRCVFLQDGDEASCSIYAARPRKCHEWPFWPELLVDPELARLAMRTCPGIEPVDEARRA